MTSIDINSDVGERPEALRDGSEEQLLKLITSANIACGVHAGDEQTMTEVVLLAKRYSVGVGAHPSFPDRQNFGRTEMNLTFDEIKKCVYDQVRTLATLANKLGVSLIHVKPHGALYNMAAKHAKVAHAIAAGVGDFDKSLVLMGLAGSDMLRVWRELGFRVVAEAFADRLYESDGSLRSRKFPDALITDPQRAAQQALSIVRDGYVIASDGSMLPVSAETLCVHSDTRNAAEIVLAVRKVLEANAVRVARLSG
jgi:UPF0271 protein